jgi:hypothetical protein
MTAIQAATSADRLADSLRRVVRGRNELDVAQFTFVGLDGLARAHGVYWPQRRDRFWQIAEIYLLNRIEEADILVRGETGFLVVFASRTGARAEFAAQNLAAGVSDRFHGLAEGPSPELAVETRTMPAAQVARMLREHGARVEPAAPATPALPAPTQVDWLFQPVWDARREVISSYFLLPHLKGTVRRVPGYQFEPGQEGGRATSYVDLDVASLERSEEALRNLAAAGKRALIGATIHIQSLMNAGTSGRILNRFSQFDRKLAGYRLLKLAGVGPGFPRLHLGHIIGSLKARVPLVVLTASWDEPDMASLARTGPTAIGFAYPDDVAGSLSRIAEGTLLSRFRAGADVAHAQGMSLYAEGQIGAGLARTLVESGADYVSSPQIWKPQAEADSVSKWPASLLSS